jgi:CDGSH-type Zn-finger protein/uncharacterized Fe-S cluster protein YjdI
MSDAKSRGESARAAGQSPEAAGRTRDYRGKQVTIRYDAQRCIHAAECVRGAPAVFDPQARPWIQPDQADAGHLAQVVARCPTGALTLHAPDGSLVEAAPGRNVAHLQPRGPIYLRGRVTIPGGEHATLVEYTRVALCRCGASANKPFCDGSHERLGFADAGACANMPASVDAEPAGPVRINPIPDGPLMVEGKVEFRAADGASFVAEKVWLCRCGQSANKPFCDGTHKKIGFTG